MKPTLLSPLLLLLVPLLCEAKLKAVCVVSGTAGGVKGVVTIEQTFMPNMVTVKGTINGLSASKHALNLHEYGDISVNGCDSAEGVHNPTGQKHPNQEGTLGNIENGKAFTFTKLTLCGMAESAIGRAIVVREKEADLTTDPDGNAGARVGCGVCGWAKP